MLVIMIIIAILSFSVGVFLLVYFGKKDEVEDEIFIESAPQKNIIKFDF